MKQDHFKTCILGAGLTGLSAAYHMEDDDYVVFEKDGFVGGNCRSEEKDGFLFDLAGHIFYPKTDYVLALVRKLLGDNLTEADRSAWIYSYDTYTRYPFQANLYGLPAEVIKDCLVGLHQAKLREAREGEKPSQNFLDFIYSAFGEGIAKHFMIPFNEKHWRYPLDELTTDWMGKFVPRPSFEQTLEGSLRPAERCIGQNARFLYPKDGGIQAVCDSFLPHMNDVQLNTTVSGLDVRKKVLTINGDREIGYERIISTMPLPVLLACAKDLPTEVSEAGKKLKWNSLHVVNVAVDKPSLTERHRLYLPDPDLVFHKLAFFSSYAPSMSPEGKCGASAEVTYSDKAPIDSETAAERVVEGMGKVGILQPGDEVLFTHVMEMPYAYVIYDENRAAAADTIRTYFASHDVHCCGRYGDWEYQNMEKNILSGRDAAQPIGPGN